MFVLVEEAFSELDRFINQTKKVSKKEQAKKNIVSASNRTLGVDINTVGSLDRTRADITDYFNYSFNEYTWKAYCTKQKQMREDQHARKKIHIELNSLFSCILVSRNLEKAKEQPNPEFTFQPNDL
ncbi:hypothetical protein C2G38_2228079 [Gigaspora rosea]|uniref:Pre-mRNA polyadenylation factor Fip1 domain-containing protein n=1 Tax=Gigaspora rosea TaxID=44941 RepID=A0A397TWS3_9GLOM|nr:hypothetical protein C2G38_2228079 [Gigaspora rosea]